MLPMTMKKAYIATKQITASQNASRTVRVDSASRPGCATWRCIRSFLRSQGCWGLVRIVTRGSRPHKGAHKPLEAAPFARVDETWVAPAAVPVLEPRVDHPQGRERQDRDGQAGHLGRLQRAEDEEEAEHEQHAEREDPEEISHDVEVAHQTLDQRKHPLPQR